MRLLVCACTAWAWFNVYRLSEEAGVAPQWLGRANTTDFVVAAQSRVRAVRFAVQAVGRDGSTEPLESAASVLLVPRDSRIR